MRHRIATAALPALALALLAAACATGGGDDRPTITVLAAASLTDAFEELAAAFEDANPGTGVSLLVAGSSSLREQVLSGVPGDVLASADEANLEELVEVGEARAATVFATNELQLAVPAGNEAGVTGLADLARDELLVGLCAAEVPCGRYGDQALGRAGVEAAPDTREHDVRSLLAKVAAGELDAGIVYRTDVLAAGEEVEGIEIPAEHQVAATYSIAVLTRSPAPDLAEAFLAFVRSEEGQAILAAHGFGPP